MNNHFWQFCFLFLEVDLENELRGRNVIRKRNESLVDLLTNLTLDYEIATTNWRTKC